MGDASPPPGSRCAAHPEVPATDVCGRCGTFICVDCLDFTSEESTWCASCRARAGMDRMPWEREERSAVRRARRTLVGLALRPETTFAHARPHRPRRAFGFFLLYTAFTAAGLGLLNAGLGLLILGFQPPGTAVALVELLVVRPLVTMAIVAAGLTVAFAIQGVLFHLAAAVVGGKGTLSASYWAVAYASVCSLAWIPVAFLVLVPALGVVLLLGAALGIQAWYAVTLSYAARSVHELSPGRALVASMIPVGLSVALFCLWTSLFTFLVALSF